MELKSSTAMTLEERRQNISNEIQRILKKRSEKAATFSKIAASIRKHYGDKVLNQLLISQKVAEIEEFDEIRTAADVELHDAKEKLDDCIV